MGVRGSQLYEFTEIQDAPSGEYLENDIPLAIVDDTMAIIKSVNYGSIIISATVPSAHVKGSNTAALVNGTGTLKSVILESSPGDEDVGFLIKSTVIDYDLVQYINPDLYGDQLVSVDFRW